ncbi:hypothetical protein V8G54_037204 [Vigna mungo]|uniref:Putative plant transposon protein domain-containing protein n=1 Tax=Vigna mungo TaxID=3915 RepID=A0AAQ3RH99_VIGMU
MSYVRGKRIPFDADTINSFLNTVWRGADDQCDYSRLKEGVINYEEIEQTLCIPGGTFQRNRQEQPLHIKRPFLTSLSKLWISVIHANISPCSHVSDISVNRAVLLFCIITERSVDLGRFISNEITTCAHPTNVKSPLGHPSLITQLCELAGVNISTPPFEVPRKAIDLAYFEKYCLDEEDVVIPPPQSPRLHRRSHPTRPPADPYQMLDMKLALIDAKLEAVNRIGLVQADMMRQVFASSHPSLITPAEYVSRVAWPGDQPYSTEGGGASSHGATTDDDDE